jgi:WD40 repeat protein
MRIAEEGEARKRFTLPNTRGSAEGLAFVDDERLLVADTEQGLTLFDVSGAKAKSLATQEPCGSVVVSPGGSYALSGPGKVRLWRVGAAKLSRVTTLKGVSGQVAWAGQWIVVSGSTADPTAPGSLWRVDLSAARPKPERIADLPGACGPAALTPCGSYALTGGDDQRLALWSIGSEGAEQVAERADHRPREQRLPMHTSVRGKRVAIPRPLSEIHVSPGGSRVLTVGEERSILWELAEGSVTAAAELVGAANCAAFSPDGQRIALGARGDSDSAFLWQVSESSGGQALKPHPEATGRGRLLGGFRGASGDAPW